MKLLKITCYFFVVAFLAACGGGSGGGAPTSISVSKTSLNFTTYLNESDGQNEIVSVTFKGDGILVGYPVGISDPGWLFVDENMTSANSATYTVTAVPTNSAGTYTTTLRFLTGKEDGSDIVYRDITVTNIVKERFSATIAGSGQFTAKMNKEDSVLPADGYTLRITGDSAWTISSSTPWISFSKMSGTGAALVTVKANTIGAVYGDNIGGFTVIETTSTTERAFSVGLQISHAQPVVDDGLTFDITGSSSEVSLSQELRLSDENQGLVPEEIYQWSIKSVSAPWMSLSATSGTTAPGEQPNVQIDKSQMIELNNSIYNGQIVVTMWNEYEPQKDYTIDVALSVTLPELEYVSPYIAVESQSGNAILRGKNLPGSGAAVELKIGEQLATSVSFDSSSQIKFSYAGLAAGSYVISIENNLGIELPGVTLRVISLVDFSKSSILAPGRRDKLLFDAERNTLYAVNREESTVERFKYDLPNGWSSLPGLVLPQLKDISMTPDGKELLVATSKNIYSVDLTSEIFSAVLQSTMTDDWCGIYMDKLVGANDGTVIVIKNYSQCSGSTFWSKYSVKSHSFMEDLTYVYNGMAAASGDGAHIYFGENGLSPAQPIRYFDALTNEITVFPITYNLNAISVSVDAARIILQDTDVYDSNLVLQGYLPYGGVSLVSRDGSKAYLYRDDNDQARIEVYDLDGALQSGAVYPLIDTINIDPVLSNSGSLYNVRLLESPNGENIFVSGDLRIAVESLN